MIFITGDTHGEFHRFGDWEVEGKDTKEETYIIVCGDLGLCWKRDDSYDYQCEFFKKSHFTLLWVQGNHENYDMIKKVPEEKWHGGKVRHIVRDKVILLERGQVFEIEGKTFFTFGGASSHDVQGGILDRNDIDFDWMRRKAIDNELPFRIIGESWWKEELPNEEELAEGIRNLEAAGNQVDYIITHCCSTGTQEVMNERYKNSFEADVLTDYLEAIKGKVSYRHWFFGHYHANIKVDEKHTLLYTSIVSLSDAVHKPIIGHPAYLRDEEVIFRIGETDKYGKIEVVDEYGTFEQSEEPSYDVYVQEENCLYKHIRESYVTRR